MQCAKIDRLTLARTKGVSSRVLLPLIDQSATLDELISNATGSLAEKIHQAFQQQDPVQRDADLAWLEGQHNHLISIDEAEYPDLLREIPDPPMLLFVQGNMHLLGMPQIAIVGSRNPSRTGLDNAYAFARHLAESGLTITSGMALGIDGKAHQGCLAANGMTLAVVGTGTDRIYPASHHQLAHQIVENGAIISEFPPGTQPKAAHFPQRNRIISGLSLGTLVVEATIKSGSLITARHATEQGREVFAIPGSIHNPQSKGCHKLIKEGAKLVETAQDIIEELGALLAGVEHHQSVTYQQVDDKQAENSEAFDEDYQLLLNKMGWDPISVEALVAATRLPAKSVSSMLLLLELQGHVSSAAGGYFSRTIPSS